MVKKVFNNSTKILNNREQKIYSTQGDIRDVFLEIIAEFFIPMHSEDLNIRVE